MQHIIWVCQWQLILVIVLFCSLAVRDPRVGHTMDILSPFISVLWHYDWLFHRESVHILMLSIQAVHGLPRLRTPGIVPCIISLSLILMNSLTICWKMQQLSKITYACIFFWNVSSWFLLRLQCSLAIGHCCFQYVHVIHSYLKIFIGWIFTFLEPYTSPLFWFNVSTLFVVVCVTDEVHF